MSRNNNKSLGEFSDDENDDLIEVAPKKQKTEEEGRSWFNKSFNDFISSFAPIFKGRGKMNRGKKFFTTDRGSSNDRVNHYLQNMNNHKTYSKNSSKTRPKVVDLEPQNPQRESRCIPTFFGYECNVCRYQINNYPRANQISKPIPKCPNCNRDPNEIPNFNVKPKSNGIPSQQFYNRNEIQVLNSRSVRIPDGNYKSLYRQTRSQTTKGKVQEITLEDDDDENQRKIHFPNYNVLPDTRSSILTPRDCSIKDFKIESDDEGVEIIESNPNDGKDQLMEVDEQNVVSAVKHDDFMNDDIGFHAFQCDDVVEFKQENTEQSDDIKKKLIDDAEMEDAKENKETLKRANPKVKEDAFVAVKPVSLMFGTYKTETKNFQVCEDHFGFFGIRPNSKKATFKFNISIPFEEIEKILISFQDNTILLFVQPNRESVEQIQKSMNIGPTSDYKFDPKSKHPGHKWIIIEANILPEDLETIESVLIRNEVSYEHIVDSNEPLKLVDYAVHPDQYFVQDSDSKSSKVSKEIIISPKLYSPEPRRSLRGNSSPISSVAFGKRKQLTPNSRSPFLPCKKVTSIITIEDGEDDDSESENKTTEQAIIDYSLKTDEKNRISIYEKDLTCLAAYEFLNDSVVCFYLKYILNEFIDEDLQRRVHIFDPLFYLKLAGPKPRNEQTIEVKVHEKAKPFIKNMNIFEKELLFIPVVQYSHWFLAIVCFPNNLKLDTKTKKQEEENSKFCIIFMDSMASSKSSYRTASLNIRRFIQVEFKERNNQELNLCNNFELYPNFFPKVPQQPNGCDCGIFVLKFVEHFFKDRDKILSQPECNLEDWFDPSEVTKHERNKIRDLILSMTEPETAQRIRAKIGVKDDSVKID